MLYAILRCNLVKACRNVSKSNSYFGVPTTQVRVAGFSQYGREWIANGMVSTFIAFITYQVISKLVSEESQ